MCKLLQVKKMNKEELEKMLSSDDEDVRYAASLQEEIKLTHSQIDRGLKDPAENVRASFARNMTYKPSDSQVETGLHDKSDNVVKDWLYRNDISLKDKTINYILYKRSEEVIKTLLERSDIKLDPTQTSILFKMKDPRIKWECLMKFDFNPSSYQIDEIIHDEEANLSLLHVLVERKNIKLSQQQMIAIFDTTLKIAATVARRFAPSIVPKIDVTDNFCSLILSELSKREEFLPTEEQERYILEFDADNKTKGNNSKLLEEATKHFKDRSLDWLARRERNKLLKIYPTKDNKDKPHKGNFL